MSAAVMDSTPDLIARALATPGGHLAIGRGGSLLHFGWGCTVSGHDCEQIKAQCIAAGLPVIDSRTVEIVAAYNLVVRGPMVAVGREPDDPPWHALSDAPLQAVADAYRAAGAAVFNLPAATPATSIVEASP